MPDIFDTIAPDTTRQDIFDTISAKDSVVQKEPDVFDKVSSQSLLDSFFGSLFQKKSSEKLEAMKRVRELTTAAFGGANIDKEEFEKQIDIATEGDQPGVLGQTIIGIMKGATGGIGFDKETETDIPKGTVERISRMTGEFAGFITGAPVKAGTAVAGKFFTSKIGQKFSQALIRRFGKNVPKWAQEALALGSASTFAGNENLTEIVSDPSVDRILDDLVERTKHFTWGAAVGGRFGIIRDKIGKFGVRIALNLAISNGTNFGLAGFDVDNMPLEDIVFNSLLDVWFSKNGKKPTIQEEKIIKESSKNIAPEVAKELKALPAAGEPEIKFIGTEKGIVRKKGIEAIPKFREFVEETGIPFERVSGKKADPELAQKLVDDFNALKFGRNVFTVDVESAKAWKRLTDEKLDVSKSEIKPKKQAEKLVETEAKVFEKEIEKEISKSSKGIVNRIEGLEGEPLRTQISELTKNTKPGELTPDAYKFGNSLSDADIPELKKIVVDLSKQSLNEGLSIKEREALTWESQFAREALIAKTGRYYTYEVEKGLLEKDIPLSVKKDINKILIKDSFEKTGGVEFILGNKDKFTVTKSTSVPDGVQVVQWKDGTPVKHELYNNIDEAIKRNPYIKNVESVKGANVGKKERRIISDEAYKKAKKNITDKGQRLTTGIDPSLIGDYVTVGAYHFENGLRTFSSWSKKMIEEFGDRIKTHLRTIWDKISKEQKEAKVETSVKDKWNRANRQMRIAVAKHNKEKKEKIDDIKLHNILEDVTGKRSFKEATPEEIKSVSEQIGKMSISETEKYQEFKKQELEKIQNLNIKKEIESVERRTVERRKRFIDRKNINSDATMFSKSWVGDFFSKILDIRYAWETAEENTGAPFKTLGNVLDEGGREVKINTIKHMDNIFIEAKVPAGEVVGDKAVQKAITEWIISGGKTDLPAKYQAVAKALIKELQMLEPDVRKVRTLRYWNNEAPKPMNASKEILEEGKKILLEQGEKAFDEWIKKQDYGVIKEGYLPGAYRAATELDDFTSTLFLERSKAWAETRIGDYYNNVPLFSGVRRYFMNVEAYKILHQYKVKLEQLLDEVQASSLDKRMVKEWWKRLNGINVANDPISNVINKFRGMFWTAELNANLFIYGRNFLQNPNLLYQKLGFGGMVKHGWKLFIPNIKLAGTNDPLIQEILKRQFHNRMNEMVGLTDDYFYVQDAYTKHKLTTNARRVVRFLPAKYGYTDLFNRLKAFRIVYDNGSMLLEQYKKGKIKERELFKKSGGYNLTNLEQRELLMHLDRIKEPGYNPFLENLSERVTQNTHFLYTRFGKGLAEQFAAGQHGLDVFTWFKGTVQNFYKGGIERVYEGMKKKNYSEAYSGLRTVAMFFLAGEAIGEVSQLLFGRGSGYGLGSLSWKFGGVGIGTLIEFTEGVSGFFQWFDSANEDEVVAQYAKMRAKNSFDTMTRLVPFVDIMIRMHESVGNVKGVTLWKLVQKEIMKDGNVTWNRARRTSLQSWQYFLFGGSKSPEQTKFKDLEKLNKMKGLEKLR